MISASEHIPMLEDLQARGLEIPDYSAATGFLRRVGEHRAGFTVIHCWQDPAEAKAPALFPARLSPMSSLFATLTPRFA